MCQRPNCAYVHPAFANVFYKNQIKKQNKGGKGGTMPFVNKMPVFPPKHLKSQNKTEITPPDSQ
jgi:hypothetical protein